MKKKITLLTIAVVVLASCGPKRMKCYGRRCLVEAEKQKPVPKDTNKKAFI